MLRIKFRESEISLSKDIASDLSFSNTLNIMNENGILDIEDEVLKSIVLDTKLVLKTFVGILLKYQVKSDDLITCMVCIYLADKYCLDMGSNGLVKKCCDMLCEKKIDGTHIHLLKIVLLYFVRHNRWNKIADIFEDEDRFRTFIVEWLLVFDPFDLNNIFRAPFFNEIARITSHKYSSFLFTLLDSYIHEYCYTYCTPDNILLHKHDDIKLSNMKLDNNTTCYYCDTVYTSKKLLLEHLSLYGLAETFIK